MQLIHRLPAEFVRSVLRDYNAGSHLHGRIEPLRPQFQRALRGLGVAHIVAPTPQAKGKIERRFGTFQNRFVTLLAHAKAKTYVY